MDKEKRAIELLKAVKGLLELQEQEACVLNLLEETVFYDEADCDGSCLLDDIRDFLDDLGE